MLAIQGEFRYDDDEEDSGAEVDTGDGLAAPGAEAENSANQKGTF